MAMTIIISTSVKPAAHEALRFAKIARLFCLGGAHMGSFDFECRWPLILP
jgi:hypothetical protein